jgi:hypothetical protein
MVSVMRRFESFYQRFAAPVHVESLFRQAVSQVIDRKALGVFALAIVDGRFAIMRRHGLLPTQRERESVRGGFGFGGVVSRYFPYYSGDDRQLDPDAAAIVTAGPLG